MISAICLDGILKYGLLSVVGRAVVVVKIVISQVNAHVDIGLFDGFQLEGRNVLQVTAKESERAYDECTLIAVRAVQTNPLFYKLGGGKEEQDSDKH
jgi:hypothetical protein